MARTRTRSSGALDRPVSGLLWARDGTGVYFGVESEGSKNLYFVSAAGAVRPVTTGKQVLTVTDLSASGLAVGVRQHAAQAERRRRVFASQGRGGRVGVHAAHRRQRERPRRQGARADRGDLVHVEGRAEDPGLDREAAGFDPAQEVSADPRHSRRPAGDVQRARSASRARSTRRTATWCCTRIRAAARGTARSSPTRSRTRIRARTSTTSWPASTP